MKDQLKQNAMAEEAIASATMTPTPQEIEKLRVEELSSIFHDIYQKEAHRQEDAGIGKARHYDEYEKLSEPVKEFDRVLARYVLSLLSTHTTAQEGYITK